jgi:hypothetical protein
MDEDNWASGFGFDEMLATEIARDHGTRLLQTIAKIRERFLDASRTLGRRPEVGAARSGYDCRDYSNGVTLEFYLEADVSGRTVCWWLSAAWRGDVWEVSAGVLENRNDREYQDQRRDWPVRGAATAESMAAELEAATEALLATTDEAAFLSAAD